MEIAKQTLLDSISRLDSDIAVAQEEMRARKEL